MSILRITFYFFLIPLFAACTFLVDFDQKRGETSCNDGMDNDGDGFTDCQDSDCAEDLTNCPISEVEICYDGWDNDRDDMIDCQDSDCAEDLNCSISEVEICDDGRDNDRDGMIDCQDPDCAEDLNCPISEVEICNDGMDNDRDGMIDCQDSDCFQSSDCLLQPCNQVSEWFDFQGNLLAFYFSEVFGNDECPNETICSVRTSYEFVPFPVCYPTPAAPAELKDSCDDEMGAYCKEGLMCGTAERTGERVCLPHCAPDSPHVNCPQGMVCFNHQLRPIGTEPGEAEIFLCDEPNCDIWNPTEFCGSNQACFPTIERYGNGACHPKASPPILDGFSCGSYNECSPGSVCEKGNRDTTTVCHRYCKPGQASQCPMSLTCVVRDPRDAWGICDVVP